MYLTGSNINIEVIKTTNLKINSNVNFRVYQQ